MSGSLASAVVFDDVTLAYDGHPAVHHLSGALARGSLTAIVGPNGSGKTTLMKGMVGLLRPADGRIERYRSRAAVGSPICPSTPRSKGVFRFP